MIVICNCAVHPGTLNATWHSISLSPEAESSNHTFPTAESISKGITTSIASPGPHYTTLPPLTTAVGLGRSRIASWTESTGRTIRSATLPFAMP